MAIGDKPNQNLFGTNYNFEEEEKKQALLAAQNAMMGAGSPTGMGAATPASTFGQAPATNSFSFQPLKDPSFNTPNFDAIPQTPEQERRLQRVGQEALNDDIRDGFISGMVGQREGFEEPMSFQEIDEARDTAYSQDFASRYLAGEFGNSLNDRVRRLKPDLSRANRDLNKFTNTFAQSQAPATFLPYADDVAPPPASALSVFTPGGEVKPNVDVNAITPSPEMTSTSAVNTPLNQEVAVGPTSNEPGFLYNTFVNAPVKADQIATEFMSNLGNKISTGYDNLLGSAMRNLTPAEDRRFANNEPFGKTFTDTFAITRPDGTKFYPDEVTSSAGATQAPSEASALGATPSVTPPVETPSEGAQGQTAALDPTSDEAILANRAQREAQFAPTNGLTTVGGASLSEFLSGQAMPEQGFTQAERPLGGRGVTLTPDQMNALSAEREARIGADQTISDRDRRAARGDGISMADQTDMAKANARGASPREVARGNQVANALGVDLATGQSLQATGGLTFEQQLSLRKQNFAEGKFDYELAKDAKTAYSEGIEASRKATTEEAQADTAGRTMVSAISNMNDAMTRMGGRSGEFFGGGFFGKMASYLPGTSAYDQVADVEFLQSNVALNAMSELKELSPTGSTGFGALSEKELRVLTDKYANLNPFVSADLFQGNLKQLQGEFNNMLNNAWDKHSKEYSPEAANAVYGNRGGSASGATGTPGQAIPNDRNITSAADTLLSDPKYN